jgi:hypothetical protein
MNRIQRTSLFFRVLFQVVLVVLPVSFVYAWVAWANSLEPIYMMNGVIHFSFVPQAYMATAEHGSHILHALSPTEKLLVGCVNAVPMAVVLYIFYSLVKLFKLYEYGEIFSMANVRYIRNIGYALLVGQLIEPFYQAAVGFILTIHNPPGNGFVAITLDQNNIETILIALMVILISWIMTEGCKLREEQQLTI